MMQALHDKWAAALLSVVESTVSSPSVARPKRPFRGSSSQSSLAPTSTTKMPLRANLAKPMRTSDTAFKIPLRSAKTCRGKMLAQTISLAHYPDDTQRPKETVEAHRLGIATYPSFSAESDACEFYGRGLHSKDPNNRLTPSMSADTMPVSRLQCDIYTEPTQRVSMYGTPARRDDRTHPFETPEIGSWGCMYVSANQQVSVETTNKSHNTCLPNRSEIFMSLPPRAANNQHYDVATDPNYKYKPY